MHRRTLLALNELGQAVTASLKLEDVLSRALTQVGALLKADVTVIQMPVDDKLLFVAVGGQRFGNLKGTRVPRDKGVADYVLRTGEPVWYQGNQFSAPGLILNPKVVKLATIQVGSLLAAPLRQGNETIGVLQAAHERVDGLSPDDLPILIAAGYWTSIAIANAQLHEQAQAAREQQALLEERNRLARELHDAVTQSLYSIATLAGAWRRQIGAGRLEPRVEHIAELGELAQQALREVRLLIYELRPTELDEEGLIGALSRRLEFVEKRSGVETMLLVTDDHGIDCLAAPAGQDMIIDFYRLPAQVEHGLFRIAQEALNNALKYSKATLITVCVRLGRNTLSMEIRDNGRGFDVSQALEAVAGFGLEGMRERAQYLGGQLNVTSSPDEGTTVAIEGVPYRIIDTEEMLE